MLDSEIVELYWQRNESAVEATVSKYGAYCYTVAHNILSNKEDSEECVSETWFRAWNTIPPQNPTWLGSFLAKITRNISLDLFKSKKAGKRGGGEFTVVLEELAECVASSANVEKEVEMQELQKSINAFLKTLSSRDSDVFLRRYFYVEGIPEIANRYSININNVSAILSRTRKKLAEHLIKEGFLNE